MSRWKAASIHLALSVLVLATVACLVVALWYPIALLHLSGVDRLMGLIGLVDVTVGPLLTLVVFRQGKPGLRLDMSLIAAMQLCLLGYGLHVLAQNRPVFLVGVVDRLELVTAKDIAASDLAEASEPFHRLSWTGAQLVGAPLPLDHEIRKQLLADAAENRDIHVQPRYYTAFDLVRGELLIHAKALDALLENATPAEREAILDATGAHDPATLRYLVVHTGSGYAMMLVDRQGMLGDFVDVDPYDIRNRTSAP